MKVLRKMWCRISEAGFNVAIMLLHIPKPELITGAGSVKKLPAFIKSKGIKKVLVVTDKGLMSLHLLDDMFSGFDEVGLEYVLYDGVQPNPTIDNIEQARKLYIEGKCEGFVAFGGGSSMDCAKATGARIVRPNTPVKKMRGQLKILKKLPPFFAVPTTAGTGSETTLAAVVTDSSTHEKYALNDPVLVPHYAVLDPLLTVKLPPHITSTTGLDALTHAVEAYTNKYHCKDTLDKAEKAVKLIFENLLTAYKDGGNIQARENMLLASHYAGIAFTRDMVGYVHAIAHNLGGLYGIPHGLANSVILPYVLDYFGETAYPRLKKLAVIAGVAKQEDGEADAAKAFIAAIRELNKQMDIPLGFEQIKEEDIPTLVKRAIREGVPLYPVPRLMDEQECEGIIRSLMLKKA